MSAIPFKSTKYAPDIYKALNGMLLLYKPPRVHLSVLLDEVRERISEALNEYKQRPLSAIVKIVGETDEEKSIIERPNLADHPLVVGPRYVPWELALSFLKPPLQLRSSGLTVALIGNANRRYLERFTRYKLVNVYHITGKFGYVTDNFFYDGRITDKTTYKYIRTGKIDSVLAKIQSTQYNRIFECSSIPLDSQEAYEVAKAWPARPAKMSRWPVIYGLRCIHCKIPEFKLEVTVLNETEQFLAQLIHDIGQMLKSSAYTESIRRVKVGPFDIDSCLTDKDFDLQSIIDNLQLTAKIRSSIEPSNREFSNRLKISH